MYFLILSLLISGLILNRALTSKSLDKLNDWGGVFLFSVVYGNMEFLHSLVLLFVKTVYTNQCTYGFKSNLSPITTLKVQKSLYNNNLKRCVEHLRLYNSQKKHVIYFLCNPFPWKKVWKFKSQMTDVKRQSDCPGYDYTNSKIKYQSEMIHENK